MEDGIYRFDVISMTSKGNPYEVSKQINELQDGVFELLQIINDTKSPTDAQELIPKIEIEFREKRCET